MKLIHILYFGVLLIITGACASKSPSSSSSGPEEYEEDLSGFVLPYSDSLQRLSPISPSPEMEEPEVPEGILNPDLSLELAVTDSINILLDSITVKNKDNTYRGYTIQVYSGSNREEANEAKNKVYQVLPSSKPRISYVQPNFKVRVGEFVERLEAQKMYITLKEEFPGAMIIPREIKIN